MASASQDLRKRHPLQGLSSLSRSASAILHALSLCSFAGSYWYLSAFPTYVNASYGWHWQYLTILGLAGATLTFAFGLLADITLWPKFFFIKNSLAMTTAPLEVLVALLYWSISAIDRTLVIPPEIDLSPWADVGFHLVPAVVLTIDLLFFSPPWTINAVPAMGLSSIIAVAYWVWIEHCYKANGWYPYPLFELLSTRQRVGLFAGAALLMTASTLMLTWLYGRVNGFQGAQRRATPANRKGQ